MKLSVDRAAFAEELRLCAHAVAKRDMIPVMKCVLLRAEGDILSISATDLDVTLQTSIPAEIEGGGGCVVDFDVLRRSVAESPEEAVTLSLGSDRRLTVKSGPFTIGVSALPAKDFPEAPETPETAVSASWADVQDLISRVRHASSEHDTDQGFTLSGVALEVANRKLAAMATDRHRLALAEINGQPRTMKFFSMIQARACGLIMATEPDGDASIGSDDRFTVFTVGVRSIFSRNSEIRFPSIREIIPQAEVSAIIQAEALRGAIRRAGITRGEVLRLDVSNDRVVIATANQRGETREAIPCEYAGASFSVGYEASYIADAVGAIRADRIILGFANTTDMAPLLLHGEPPDDAREHIEVVMARMR